jgi:hypothetical protein
MKALQQGLYLILLDRRPSGKSRRRTGHSPSAAWVSSSGCRADYVWEHQTPLPPRNNGGEATFFWKSDPSLATPTPFPTAPT